MDLYNLRLELRALRTITDESFPEKKRLTLLGRLNKRFFSTEVTKTAFTRISKQVSDRSVLIEWQDLITDPRISGEIRSELSESDQKPFPMKSWKPMLEALDKYRKRRDLVAMGRTLAEIMGAKDEDVDEDQLLVDMADRLNQIKSNSGEEHKVVKFGAGGNALKYAKKVLASPAEKLLRTGYKDYDRINGGFPTAGVVLLGGSTSGGKSVYSMNLLDRMVRNNKDISALKITLEMTAEQEMNRMLSMMSGVPLWKIKQKKCTPREERAILKAAEQVEKEYAANGSSYGFLSPDRGMSVDDVLWMSTPYGANVVCIDYIGLLSDAAGDQQWKVLSEVVRKCKIHATNTNSLYIILVQLDSETGNIRYSKGMLEHADIALLWNYSDPEVRATKKLPINVAKARDGELFTLSLDERFEVMKVGDEGELGIVDDSGDIARDADEREGYVAE